MGFLDLFVVAVIPFLKVLLVTAVGLFLAMDRINLLGPEGRGYLNEIVFYLFSPALVFSNLAETITFQSLVALWFMPVNIFLTFIIGSLLGWILIKITKTPEHIRGIVIGCCSAAVCNESNNPFGESCSTYAEAYASLSMAVGAIFIWSYAYPFVSSYGSKSMEHSSSEESCKEPLLHQSYREEHRAEEGVCTISNRSSMNNNVVGFITGTISPIRKLLIGDSAPLHVLDTSIYLIGEATIPCMTFIMGANLLKGLKGSEVSLWVITGIMIQPVSLLWRMSWARLEQNWNMTCGGRVVQGNLQWITCSG